MHQFYRGKFFNFEAVRILGTARGGGAEVAEFLEAIGQIQENVPESWLRAWNTQSERVEGLAKEAAKHGHRTAAKEAFLRASNYARAAAYMLVGDGLGNSDTRVVPLLRRAKGLFRSATRFFDGEVHEIQVPYDKGVSLPAYLYLPPASCRLPGKLPLVVTLVGADSIQEEIYYTQPSAGPGLGYAMLTFDGPGQGLLLHEHGISMRPDWEDVVEPIICSVSSYAKQKSLDIDWERVAVSGASLGAYFALRVAASHPRYKAVVAVDPLYDMYDFATKHVNKTFFNSWERGLVPDWFVDSFINFGTRMQFQMRWEIGTTSRFLGATSPTDLLRQMRRYTFKQTKGTYLDRVSCPVLVTGAAHSLYFDTDDHTGAVFRDLPSPDTELWIANAPGEGSLQAKVGAMPLCNQRAFQFLDKQFGITRKDLFAESKTIDGRLI